MGTLRGAAGLITISIIALAGGLIFDQATGHDYVTSKTFAAAQGMDAVYQKNFDETGRQTPVNLPVSASAEGVISKIINSRLVSEYIRAKPAPVGVLTVTSASNEDTTCAATLIRPDIVLTAAACLFGPGNAGIVKTARFTPHRLVDRYPDYLMTDGEDCPEGFNLDVDNPVFMSGDKATGIIALAVSDAQYLPFYGFANFAQAPPTSQHKLIAMNHSDKSATLLTRTNCSVVDTAGGEMFQYHCKNADIGLGAPLFDSRTGDIVGINVLPAKHSGYKISALMKS